MTNFSFKLCLLRVGLLGAMVSPLPADPITIMPLGDSITVGVNSTYGSGYRDPLYSDLTADNVSFQFIGSTTSGSTLTLSNAGDAHHNGYGHYQIGDLDLNLTGNYQPASADSNAGGDWLSGTNANPDIILLMVGTNDFLQQNYANIDQNITNLVTDIHTDSPASKILIAGAIPIKGTGTDPYGDAGQTTGYYPLVANYDNYIQNTLVPSIPNTVYVDQRSNFLNSDGTLKFSLYSVDGIHPDDAGYAAIAATWDSAINAEIGAAPEPGTGAMLLAGLALLGFASWAGRFAFGSPGIDTCRLEPRLLPDHPF
jgi:lysophospholipase L1-like esterase